MKRIQGRTKKPLIFLILFLLVVGIGGTFAYYYSEVIIPNRFQAMTYHVTIEEEFYDDFGTKRVSFVNQEETNAPVVLRINYNESWRKTIDDVVITPSNVIDGQDVVTKEWTDSFLNDFADGGDGWFYYTKVLNAQESVQVLESITLNESLVSTSSDAIDYQGADYELSFNFESIQASSDAILDIWGISSTIQGDDVAWNF